LHKEQALSCHCLPLSAGGECLRERVPRGVAVNQFDSTPRQYQRYFTRGRVKSAAFLFGQKYQGVQPRVADLIRREAGIADAIRLADIPAQHQPKLDSFAADNLFQKTFSVLPVSFGLVEIDKLVAPQRTVNLDYVGRLVVSEKSQPGRALEYLYCSDAGNGTHSAFGGGTEYPCF
jgi:hypothetical protein